MKEMNPVEKWRKNQKERQKKKRTGDKGDRERPKHDVEEKKRQQNPPQRAPNILKV